MITLGTVTINDNMYLEGVEKATPMLVTQQRTVDGLPVASVSPNVGGRALTLGTSQLGNAIQGIWCQHIVDQIKVLQASGNAQVLDYHGDIYTVLIESTSSIVQLFQWEPKTPDKKYVGPLNLIEV